MNPSTMRNAGVGLVSLLFFLSLASCASPEKVKAYQDELRALREERTQLKKENRGLRAQLESYEVALAEANANLADQPAVQLQDYPELDALGVDYGRRGDNFVIALPSSITFASGKADLTKQGKEALQVVAQTLASDHGGGNYWIEGHTDADPIRKSKWGSNRELSVARAMAVLHYLVEDCGVDDEACVVAGHGQYMPMAANDDDAGKARNRRVEIVVHAVQG